VRKSHWSVYRGSSKIHRGTSPCQRLNAVFVDCDLEIDVKWVARFGITLNDMVRRVFGTRVFCDSVRFRAFLQLLSRPVGVVGRSDNPRDPA
jgi:hypothetical protein